MLMRVGFICTVVAAVRILQSEVSIFANGLTDGLQVICYPASIFCGCCLTQTGKEYVFLSYSFFHTATCLTAMDCDVLTCLLVFLDTRSKSMGP